MAQKASGSSGGWYLARIQVKAFKSFNRSASFSIGSNGLVGIVGPNGCGKSNLLEAVCFACGCSTAVLRGCRSFKNVTSTDANCQLPEVKLELAHQIKPGSRHSLEASLTAEGARVFKVNGRLKTGTQVREFLRGLGMVVDTTTVIQQASITRLTDSNNPATLADLVAAASGLNSWKQETAAARQEVARTRCALKDIHANIALVQAAAAADGSALEAATAAARLDAELEQQLERLSAAMLQQRAALQRQFAAAQQQEQELKVLGTAASKQLEQLAAQKQQLTMQQAQLLASLEASAGTESSCCGLTSSIAAAAAKLKSLQAAAAAAAVDAAELVSCKEQLQQHEGRAAQLRTLLTMKRAAAAQAAGSLQELQAAGSAADGLQQQALQMQKQSTAAAAALAQQQAATELRVEQLRQATARAAGITQQLHAMKVTAAAGAVAAGSEPNTAVDSVDAAAAAASTAAAAAAGHGQQLAAQSQQLLQLQADLEMTQRSLTPPHIAGLLSSCRAGSCSRHGQNARPLHECFTLAGTADPAAISKLLLPLSLIAGPAVLQVLVANTMQDANQLLAAAAAAKPRQNRGDRSHHGLNGGSGKLRIWPLEQLRPHNMLKAQRGAQQALGSKRVILPLDLLRYDGVFEPAMLRAIGGYVIAADDATAAELVQRFGLSSVTMQGTVSRKGSLSGGWGGSSGGAGQTMWSYKLQRDSLAVLAAAVQEQLAQAHQQQQNLEQQSSAAAAALAAAEQRQELQQELLQQKAEVAAAKDSLQQEQRCLNELQQQHSSLQQRLQQCKDALHSEQGAADGSKRAAAALEQQLQAAAKAAAAAVHGAEEELQAAEEEMEELSVRLETLEMQLSRTADDQQQQQHLQQQEQQLHELQQRHQQQQAATAALKQQLQQLQGRGQELDQQLQQQQKQQQVLQRQEQRAEAQGVDAAAGLKRCKQELKQLVKDFGCHDAVHDLAASTAGAAEGDSEEPAAAAADSRTAAAVPTAKEVQQMLRQAKRLQQEAAQLDVPELPAAQKELCTSRIAQVAQFKQQSEALQAAASALEQHMADCSAEVHAANDAVFEDIAAGFSELCSSLLPSLQLQLVRAGQQAHEGLQFRFRRLEDTSSTATAAASSAAAAAGDGDSSQWITSLGQLSGGQQTLVSLAMLLAVAWSGNGSSLFLLDEIDAALDENNQARASALLRQLARAGDGSGCQILCVTHNAAFQSVCDAFVQVGRGPRYNKQAAAAVADAVPEDSRDSKAAVGSKAAKHRAKGARQAAAGAPSCSQQSRPAMMPQAKTGRARQRRKCSSAAAERGSTTIEGAVLVKPPDISVPCSTAERAGH